MPGKLNEHLKSDQIWAIPAGNAYNGSLAPDGFHLAVSRLGSWWHSGGSSQQECLHDQDGYSGKTLVLQEIEIKNIIRKT